MGLGVQLFVPLVCTPLRLRSTCVWASPPSLVWRFVIVIRSLLFISWVLRSDRLVMNVAIILTGE